MLHHQPSLPPLVSLPSQATKNVDLFILGDIDREAKWEGSAKANALEEQLNNTDRETPLQVIEFEQIAHLYQCRAVSGALRAISVVRVRAARVRANQCAYPSSPSQYSAPRSLATVTPLRRAIWNQAPTAAATRSCLVSRCACVHTRAACASGLAPRGGS